MKHTIYIICILFTLNFISCKNGNKEKETSQMEKVMAVHDEVMPKMGTIGKLVEELKTKVDTTVLGKKYDQAMRDLQKANRSMMDWMQSFGNRFDSDEITEGKELTVQKQKWLDEEEVKINTLKKEMNSSIEKAKNLLEK